jgi:hypothetical protein
MKTVAALTFAAVVLAGCTTSSDTTTPRLTAVGISPPGETIPRVTAPGTTPISPDKQAAFCQDQVAFMYDAKPQFATTRERVVAADGSTTIDVTIDKGNGGGNTYKCRLDAGNRFVDVTASDEAQ